MRVLIDECLPRQLRQWLSAARPEWSVMTVQDAGWASMKNCVLLRMANDTFDVLLTADKNMHHHKNFAGLAVSVLVFPVNRVKLSRLACLRLSSLMRVRPGEKRIMDLSPTADWGAATLDEVIAEREITRHRFKP